MNKIKDILTKTTYKKQNKTKPKEKNENQENFTSRKHGSWSLIIVEHEQKSTKYEPCKKNIK